jgi:serine/threonine protein phosphatase 1
LRGLPNYIEDDRHIYVHAGIEPDLDDWKLTSAKSFKWIREPFYQKDGELKIGKRIVFGHQVCARLHKNEARFTPWFGKQIIGIDGGIKFGYYMNALIIDGNGKYQFETLNSCD